MNQRSIIHFLRVGTLCLTIFVIIGGEAKATADRALVHHDLTVELSPADNRIRIADRISMVHQSGQLTGAVDFYLDKRFELESHPPGAEWLVRKSRRILRLPPGSTHFQLSYQLLSAFDHEHENWLYLAPSALWYPHSDRFDRLTFTLNVKAPEGWRALSQGHGTDCRSTSASQTWRQTRPQTGIFLVASRFACFQRHTPHGLALVYLLNADEKLANTYLDATEKYLKLYSDLFGAYPYGKFALVENPRQTGYGMPSFTLLGSKVIRLPFIPHTSYPHEILHNWWGNGVFVNLESGNWAEGLTAYLADHAVRERRGRGRGFRRDALQKYTNYVHESGDFPLRDFIARHDGASQAVGYDKSLMIFHMLRAKLGDNNFRAGLRAAFQRHKFEFTSFNELIERFEDSGAVDLHDFYAQWVERTGAPSLALGEVAVARRGRQYVLEFNLSQVQPGAPFRLAVPFRVAMKGKRPDHVGTIIMDGSRQPVSLTLPDEPLRLDIDPDFDLFRSLSPEEIPVSLGALFGAQKRFFVLPETPAASLRRAYRRLAQQWAKEGDEIVAESDVAALPENSAIWLFDRANRYAGAALDGLPKSDALTADGFRRHNGSAVIATRHENRTIGLLHLYAAEQVEPLARKLLHYGKYSFVLLDGRLRERPKTGQWRTTQSPLSWTNRPGMRSTSRAKSMLLENVGSTQPEARSR